MLTDPPTLLTGFYFSPRGGSAHACRAIVGELEKRRFEVTLVAGSRSDLGPHADAERFFAAPGREVRAVDFTHSLAAASPLAYDDGDAANAPIHASYEDRPGAEDPAFARLDDDAFELQVAAWTRALAAAGAESADLLHLHHLTPLNEVAARSFPQVPVLGHIHGSELLMLEKIAARPSASEDWPYAERWVERICGWAENCSQIVVNSPEGRRRAARLLDLDPDRFVLIPNGFDPSFAPRKIHRRSHWRRHLTEDPQGWRAGEGPGSVAYQPEELLPLGGTTLLYSGRFTEVKRLTLLIEAYAQARADFIGPTSLVLLGGFPGEWEGEHPAATIARLGLDDVFLAGWHEQGALPDFLAAADVFVLASVAEQFGQVLVEAMACGVPPIAVARGGPATIVEHGESGWLVEPDDREALSAAMLEAVNDPAERGARGSRGRDQALRRYTWAAIGAAYAGELSEILDGVEIGTGAGPGRPAESSADALTAGALMGS